MRVISLIQPWASLVILGEKKLESRSWETLYRGLIGIHASKGFPKWARDLCAQEPYRSSLLKHGISDANDLPVGKILGTCTLTDCLRIVRGKPSNREMRMPEGREWFFGDYRFGRFAWKLENVKKYDTPIAATGKLGIWKFEHPLP